MIYLKYIPVAGIVINVLSVVGYAIIGDYPRAVYWCMAAGLTFTTFWMR